MATWNKTGKVHAACGNALVADAHNGVILVPARAGEHIIVVDCWVRALGGTTTSSTAIEFQGTGGTVVAVSVAAAAATQNTICRPETSSVTATNLDQPFVLNSATMIPRGEGLRLMNTGSLETTATSYDYEVQFMYEAA